MKGVFFSFDILIAFIVLLFIISFSLQFLFTNFSNEKGEYQKFSRQVNLIKVSELMVTDSNKGLVEYKANSVKHHEIQRKYWHLKRDEVIDGVVYHIEVLGLHESSSFKGESISRIALCGSDLCVVKVSV